MVKHIGYRISYTCEKILGRRNKPNNYRLKKQVDLIIPSVDGHKDQRKHQDAGKNAD